MKSFLSARKVSGVALVLAMAPFEVLGASHEATPMRSLYFPVTFETCARLQQGILRQHGEIIAKLPAKRIFMYVFDVDRRELRPLHQVLILSAKEEGTEKPVTVTILVSPGRINIGGHVLEYADVEKVFRQFARHIDARYEDVAVKIHCAACAERQCPDANESGESDEDGEASS